jgi:hypothetical protein
MGAKRMSAAMPIEATTSRRAVQGKAPDVFTDIYQEDTNIVIWQRELPTSLKDSVQELLSSKPDFQTEMAVTAQNALTSLNKSFGSTRLSELSENIAELVDMFCYLFELKQAGLRLKTLDRAMCPRFHVDKMPCRLVTTYQGIATEWLPHELVDRSKLGRGNNGLPDHESGLFQNQRDIQQLACGDVALLKGELWSGNENAGLVHRSPTLPDRKRRLLLTLDF